MWGFAWMFWMVPLFFCFAMMRRWRWERWAMAQGGYGPRGRDGSLKREVESQRTYIEELEHRIAQLEEKLDFTERLVAGRKEG
jgi:hypothetical protein